MKKFIFDLDDTVTCNYHSYSIVKLDFAKWVLKRIGLGAPEAQTILRIQTETDNSLLEEHGFSSHRFPESFRQTYMKICGEIGQKDKEGENLAYKIGKSVFDEKAWQREGLLKGTKETLDFLAQKGDKLDLLTKGDFVVQMNKYKALGLYKWFDNFYLVAKDKKPILDRMDKDTWHVANCFKSDIEPSIRAGIRSIYIPCERWDMESGYREHRLVLTFDNILDIKKNYDKL